MRATEAVDREEDGDGGVRANESKSEMPVTTVEEGEDTGDTNVDHRRNHAKQTRAIKPTVVRGTRAGRDLMGCSRGVNLGGTGRSPAGMGRGLRSWMV